MCRAVGVLEAFACRYETHSTQVVFIVACCIPTSMPRIVRFNWYHTYHFNHLVTEHELILYPPY